jgi:hypothetical protein
MNAGSTVSELGAPLPSGGVGTRFTILYDERCAFCIRCRNWLAVQPCLVPVELMASGSSLAQERYGSVPWLGQELVVVDDLGNVWAGPAAFITCLWVTARYRQYAFLFSRPRWAQHAERFFTHISERRSVYASWLSRKDSPEDCSWCDDVTARR